MSTQEQNDQSSSSEPSHQHVQDHREVASFRWPDKLGVIHTGHTQAEAQRIAREASQSY